MLAPEKQVNRRAAERCGLRQVRRFNLPTETLNETGFWDTNKSHLLLLYLLIKKYKHN